MMLFNGLSLTTMPIMLTIYQITISTVPPAIALFQFPSPAIHHIHLETMYSKKSPQTTSIFKSSIIESSLVSHSWYLEDSTGMRRVCCEIIPKHWWFCRGLSTCETMATLGKPVTLKLLVNIYLCGTQNHIFNPNFIDLLLYSGENCDQHGNYISTDFPPPPCESDCDPDDWYPYQDQIEFEVADFLHHQNQIFASDIDTMLNLWGASTATWGTTISKP